MVSAGDFRNGITIELEGNIYQIIEFQHVKPGKGAAFVRTKLKNIKSGGIEQKNAHRQELTERTCSTYILMEIYSTLWILQHMSRSP